MNTGTIIRDPMIPTIKFLKFILSSLSIYRKIWVLLEVHYCILSKMQTLKMEMPNKNTLNYFLQLKS